MYLCARHCHTTLNPKYARKWQETPPDDDQTCLAACWINTTHRLALCMSDCLLQEPTNFFCIGSNGKNFRLCTQGSQPVNSVV